MTNLHDEIIRITCNYPKDANFNQRFAYQSGHRDARHAAAEVASVADEIIYELLEALEELVSATTSVRGIDEDMENFYCIKEFMKARKAIAKAKGE